MGPFAPCTLPSGNFFRTRGEYVTVSNGVFNFNFLALSTEEQTDRRTDGRTDIFDISISRVSMLTRDKNRFNGLSARSVKIFCVQRNKERKTESAGNFKRVDNRM